MKKTYVLQMRVHDYGPWLVARTFDSLKEAQKAYNALPIKIGYRVAEAYTTVRYKAVAGVSA